MKVKLLRLKNVDGITFHLNPLNVTSFAMSQNDGDERKGCAWVAAGHQQYFLDIPSTQKLREHLELEEEPEASAEAAL